MEKAIEIKRRAQRCIQNGDLDGALNEYEKLVQAQDSDPYNFVLLADLQFKRGDADQAVQRYLAAVGSYEKAGLYKNAIAVCKKMMRLSLAPAKVLERLAALHALDGLGAEAALYYMQYAENMVRDGKPKDAAEALHKAFEASPDEVKALERMSEAWMLADDPAQAARAMGSAAYAYQRLGRLDQVERCRRRAEQLRAGTMGELAAEHGPLQGLSGDSGAPAAPAMLDPVGSAAEGAEFGGNPFAPEPDGASADGRLDGLVSPMTPARASQHLAASDLELERIPHGVLGATPGEAPPTLESDEPSGSAAGRMDEPGPHGPPRLPSAAANTGEPAGGAHFGVHPEGAGERSSEPGADEVVGLFEAAEPGDDAEALAEPAAEPVADAYAEEPVTAVYEIPDETGEPEDLVRALESAADDDGSAAPVYRIDAGAGDDFPAAEEPLPAYASDPGDGGRSNEAVATGAPAGFPLTHAPGPAGEPEHVAPALTIAEIEALLSGAQERFRTGDREGAAALLVDAALAYERAERLDNAASIFRSLARGPQTSSRLLELWLANCERRHDAREAAEVACELGDRALNDGDVATARAWFGRACEHDPANAVAQRRLSRLAELAPAAGPAAEPVAAAATPQPVVEPAAAAPAPAAARLPAAPEPSSDPDSGEGRVEMSVGRAEAVSFDLGALLSEFQRGIEAQLSGDAQSHYDLAMTYHEMGLHAQALDGFRLAAADPAFAYRAAEMIGRCLLDQGRFEEAVHEFTEALRSPKLAPEAVLGLRYQLGLAYEAAGDLNGALAEFERVFEQQANYSDVALKLRALRTSLGQA